MPSLYAVIFKYCNFSRITEIFPYGFSFPLFFVRCSVLLLSSFMQGNTDSLL